MNIDQEGRMTLKATATGTVEWNQINSGIFTDINYCDPITVSVKVTSDRFMDSPNYPIRSPALKCRYEPLISRS